MDNNDIKAKIRKSADDLPGVAVDIADDELTNKAEVDEMTHLLNNNHAGDNDLDCCAAKKKGC